MLCVLAALVWLFWYFFDTEVRNAVRWLRYGQAWLISHFVDNNFQVMFNGQPVNWQRGFNDIPRWSAERLRFEHLAYFTALTMQPLRYVYAGLLGAAAVFIYLYGSDRHYRQTLDLEGLIKRQSLVFPIIAPFVKYNPSKAPPRPPGNPVPAELPPFSEALGPEEWIAYFGVPVPDGVLDKKAAAKAFMKQLKGRWKGWKTLPPYMQVLLAAFALKASRKRADADTFLARLAVCWDSKGGLKLSRDRKLLREARKVLANKDIAGGTLEAANSHAFITSAMLGALNHAREEGGVLAPAQFVWLRAHDRTLWYPLNNLGRQSFHPEAIGAMSHYRAERRTQRPIPVPKMEDAVESMAEYMGGRKARPIPQLDYSNSKKKRGIKKAS